MKTISITKKMIEDGKHVQFENHPECYIKTLRDDVGRRINVEKDTLERLEYSINYDPCFKCLFVNFRENAHVYVPTVSIGLKLLRSIVDIYNYKTERCLRYSMIAEILGLSYEEFMSISVPLKDDLLDYPSIAEDVPDTYSEETLFMNGIYFVYHDYKNSVVMVVKKSVGMFNPNY